MKIDKLPIIISIVGILLIGFGIIISLTIVQDETQFQAIGSETTSAEMKESPDKQFLETADRAAKLISETVKEGHEYHILFELKDSKGEAFYTEQQRIVCKAKDWQNLCRKQIVGDLATAKEVVEAHDAGKTVKVASVTLSCPVYKDNGAGWYVMSTCDYDNDGTWDDRFLSY